MHREGPCVGAVCAFCQLNYFQFCPETDVFNMKVQIFIANQRENSSLVFGSLSSSLPLQWFYNYYWLNCPFQYLIPMYFADQGRCFSQTLISVFYRYLLSICSLPAEQSLIIEVSCIKWMRVTLLEMSSVEWRESRALRHCQWNLSYKTFCTSFFCCISQSLENVWLYIFSSGVCMLSFQIATLLWMHSNT